MRQSIKQFGKLTVFLTLFSSTLALAIDGQDPRGANNRDLSNALNPELDQNAFPAIAAYLSSIEQTKQEERNKLGMERCKAFYQSMKQPIDNLHSAEVYVRTEESLTEDSFEINNDVLFTLCSERPSGYMPGTLMLLKSKDKTPDQILASYISPFPMGPVVTFLKYTENPSEISLFDVVLLTSRQENNGAVKGILSYFDDENSPRKLVLEKKPPEYLPFFRN